MKFRQNPIIRKELRVSARTSKYVLALTGYALMMVMVAMGLLSLARNSYYAGFSSVPYVTRDYQSFTTCFFVFAYIQLAMICLIMPILTASSISGEREKQTLDIMLTTPISPFSIMLGKLLSAMFKFLMFLIASLPGMAVCFVYGGIQWTYMLLFLFGSIIMAFFVGAIGVYCSARFQNTTVSTVMVLIFECAFMFGPFGILGACILSQIENTLTNGTTIHLFYLPLVMLFSPAFTFVAALVKASTSVDIINEVVLNGIGNVVQVGPGMKAIVKIWYPLAIIVAIAIGFFFLKQAALLVDINRLKNRALSGKSTKKKK